MSSITPFYEGLSSVRHLISGIEGEVKAELGLARLRLVFEHGAMISVVRGHGSYSDAKTFEVAVLDPKGKLDYSLTDGDVLGYQTMEDLVILIRKVYDFYQPQLPPSSPLLGDGKS